MKYKIYIFSSIICIIIPLIGFWHLSQPNVGYSGRPTPFHQILPPIATLIMGLINLPVAIYQYIKNKNNT